MTFPVLNRLIARLRGQPYVDTRRFKHIGDRTIILPNGYFEIPEGISIGECCYIGPYAFWSGIAWLQKNGCFD